MTTYESCVEVYEKIKRLIKPLDNARQSEIMSTVMWLISQWETSIACTGDIQTVLDSFDESTRDAFYREMCKAQWSRLMAQWNGTEECIREYMDEMGDEE